MLMNALEITNLKKTYANGKQALDGIDLHIEQGDFFALLGPNGAGKSTTISIVSSLVKRSGGEVSVFGYDLAKQTYEAKSCLGIVPQEINFSMFESCMEILLNQAGYYGIRRKTALTRAQKYLKQLGLWEKRHDASRTLSGGLKRRLMIARALMNEPRMLILDEPTAGVDVELRRSMWDFLTEINRSGMTILLTTHYLEEAERLCKNIAIIDNGQIIEHSTTKELLSKLNTETFVIELDKQINTAPLIEGYSLRLIDNHTVEVDIEKEQHLNALFHQLSELKIQVRSMRNKSNRLEELFIRLVTDQQNPN